MLTNNFPPVAQRQWRVNGFGGQSYVIGLYHGDDSGHLVVYCNNNILLTDFQVLDSKQYSFFLDQELFQVRLERNGNAFTYELEHDTQIDSPHNRRQAENKRTDRWRVVALALTGIFFIILMVSIFTKRGEARREQLAALQAGGGTPTTLLVHEKEEQLIAQYPAAGQLYEKKLMGKDTISSYGFPIIPGQELAARYHPEDPIALVIDWDQPGPELLAQYRFLTTEKHVALHPELAPQHARCQVRIAYELEGLEGLAKLYGQDRPSSYRYHESVYLRLVRSSVFRERVRACL